MGLAPIGETPADTGADGPGEGKPPKKPRPQKQKNTPAFDLRKERTRICGVDLTRIDGIDVLTVPTFAAELGVDMSRWPTEDHFPSWLALPPNRDISGGKVVQREPRKS